MIVNRHTHELPAHDQPPGEVEVIPARLEAPGRVIVKEEHAARSVEQRQPKELGPVDWRLSPCSECELSEGQETVTCVEAEKSEDLAAFALQPADQVLPRDLRLIELFCGLHLGLCKSLAELDRRQQGGYLGRPQSGACRQFAEVEASDTGEAAGVGEQAVGLDDCVAATSSGADQDGQKLGVRQGTGAKLEQTLARPL